MTATDPFLQFSPDWEVEVVDGEGIVVFGPQRSALLYGAMYPRLFDAVGLGRTRAEVETALLGSDDGESVGSVLETLIRGGVLVERPGVIPKDDPGSSPRAPDVRGLPLIRVEGPQSSSVEWERLLVAAGFSISKSPDVRVVFTTDYLFAPELLAREEGDADVLLVRPVRPRAWVGPLLRPRVPPCPRCLAGTLITGRPLLAGVRLLPTWRPTASHRVVSGGGDAAHIVTAIRDVLAPLDERVQPRPSIRRLPLDGRPWTEHLISPRPECPRCGDPGTIQRRRTRPPVLMAAPVHPSSTAGFRTETSTDFVARFAPLLDPVTGLVRTTRTRPADATGHVRAVLSGPMIHARPKSLRGLGRWLRAGSSGKGVTSEDAHASALAEAAERFCTVFRGDEPRRLCFHEALDSEAIQPNDIALFSESQRIPGHATGVLAPKALPDDAEIEWSPVWSLRDGSKRYAPTALLYFGYRPPAGIPQHGRADSNGAAAGGTFEDAILQGMLELVERDAVSIWWYNRLERPELDVREGQDDYVDAVRAELASCGRSFWLLDITTDLGVPSIVAISPRGGGGADLGFGSHVAPTIAWRRATAELCQVIGFSPSSAGPGDEDGRVDLETGLEPMGRVSTDDFAQHDIQEDIRDAIEVLVRRFATKALDCLVLDLTRPDIGIPVAKVVVPGLRSHRPRFGPGRLYDVPVDMGWRPTSLAEDELRSTEVIPPSSRSSK